MHEIQDLPNGYQKCLLKWINEERNVLNQPPSFEDVDCPNHVLKLIKSMYGLKQALTTWYEQLSKFFLKNGFKKGKIYNTFFLKKGNMNFSSSRCMKIITFFGAISEYLCE